MRMARFVSKGIVGCVALGSIALLASQAGALPTTDHRHSHRDRSHASRSLERRAAELSHAIVRAAAIDDRFRLGDERGRGRGSHGERWETMRAPSPKGHVPPEILTHVAGRGGRSGPASTASPIPEPGSILTFAAGLGLIALLARRKLV